MPKLPDDIETESETGDLEHEESKVEQDAEAREQLNGDLEDDIEKTSGKQARDEDEAEEVDDDSVDADEDGGEGEYQVEAIRKHRWDGKTVLYHIKWVGYKEKDNTWEPETNLLPHAVEALAQYHHKIGGAPTNGPPSSTIKKSKSSQSLRRQSSIEESPAPKRQKRNGTTTTTAASEEPLDSWTPSKQDWEPEVDVIETIEQSDNGQLMVYVKFRNGKKTKVGMDLVYKHCPRPMLKFYEAHLKFNL